MNIFSISCSSLRFRALGNAFNIIILMLGIMAIVALLQLSTQVEQRFTRDLKGVDLVVGAKGSPLQLILSSVFHIDIPNGNIPAKEAEELAKNPMVGSAIPLAMGDNYNGFHIVGTDGNYIKHYNGDFAEGRLFSAPMEVVIGSDVALKNSLKTGSQIIGAHGLVNSDDLHSDFPYTVVGVLKPSGSVLDRLVLTPLESVWHVHEHADADDAEEMEHKKNHPENEITSLLISYKTPLAVVAFPRLVNATSSMQAASPAFEVARLIKILGVGGDTVIIFGGILILISAIGFFINLFNSVNERSYDIVLMRSLGASRSKILSLVIAEGMIPAVIGIITGIMGGHLLTFCISSWIANTKHLKLEQLSFGINDIYVMVAAVIISFAAVIIPALMAYRVDMPEILSRGK